MDASSEIVENRNPSVTSIHGCAARLIIYASLMHIMDTLYSTRTHESTKASTHTHSVTYTVSHTYSKNAQASNKLHTIYTF